MSLGRNCPLPCSNAHGTRPGAHNMLEELLQHQEQIKLLAQTWKKKGNNCANEQTALVRRNMIFRSAHLLRLNECIEHS